MSKSWKLKEVLENFGTILENFGKVLENFGKILENFEKFYLGIVVKVLWRHVVLKNVFESHISYGPIGFPCDFKSSSKNIMKASLIMSLWWI